MEPKQETTISNSLKVQLLTALVLSFSVAFYRVLMEEVGEASTRVFHALLTDHRDVLVLFSSMSLGYSIAIPAALAGMIILFPFKNRSEAFLNLMVILLFSTIVVNLGSLKMDNLI